MIRAKALAVAFTFTWLLAAPATNGQQNSVEPTLLALEVFFYANEPPAYQAVPSVASSPSGAWYARFRPVRGWTPPSDSPPVRAVNIRSVLVGDSVRIWISAFLGELHEQEKDVTSYSLHEGEKITVQKLAQFGVEPFDIAVVRLAPGAVDIPQVKSKAKSVEFVAIKPVFSTLPSYQVAVRNLSSKNISALRIQVMQAGRTQITSMPQGREADPLILAGGIYESTETIATRASATPGGYTPVTLPNQVIEISTAVFEDGSFEGEIESAITFRAFVKGRKIQLGRVVELFQKALEDDRSEPINSFELLKSDVAALNLEADSVAVQAVLSEFQSPVRKTEPQLKTMIEIAMKGIREDVLNNLQQFRLRNPKLDPLSFHTWLAASKQRYETWLSHL